MGKGSEQHSTNPLKKFILGLLDGESPRKLIRQYWYDDKEGLRKGWKGTLLTIIIVSSFAVCATIWTCNYLAAQKYEPKIKSLTTILDTTKGELKDAKQDRDKYQLMLAPFQAMAIQVYTNVPTEKRLDLLAAQFTSISSNLLITIETDKPSFSLYLNNQLVTNGASFSLKDNRSVNLAVRNTSPVTAEKTTIDFCCPSGIAKTNFNGGEFWKSLASRIYDEKNNYLGDNDPRVNYWEWVADENLPGFSLKAVNTFTISTNMPWPVIGDVQFRVSSSRSKIQVFTVSLSFQ